MSMRIDDREKRDRAWDYYALHVEHRARLFNYTLVVLGSAVVAYTSLLGNEPVLAGVVAMLAAFAVSLLLAIEVRTLAKIDSAKELIANGDSAVEDLLRGPSGPKDRWWKMALYLSVIGAFCGMAAHAYC